MWKPVFIFCVILCYKCPYLDGASLQNASSEPAPKINSRIVGGISTSIERHPYAAQLTQNNRVFCGGSIVSERHILTAAHCIVNDFNVIMNPRQITVRVGTATAGSGGTTSSVSAIIKHEYYDIRYSTEHDIAILLLPRRLSLNARIAVISLAPTGYVIPNNTMVTAVGWGTMSNGAMASVLQEVTVPAVNTTECSRRYQQQNLMITDAMICAGVLGVGGQDACQGDSGGALVYGTLVVGVTSWGLDCGHPNFPGVYARVASYNIWIQTTIQRSSAVTVQTGLFSLLIPVFIFIVNNKFYS